MSNPCALRLPAAFNRLAWSNLAAQSAEQIGLAAAPMVAVLAIGAGAGETGLLQTAQTLPFLLFSLPAGLLVDRMPRRLLMAGAEALRALALLTILALLLAGGLGLPLLALLGFIGACGTVVYGVAAPALVPALVAPPLLARANARIELARTVAFAGGPAMAGLLVGWSGAGPAYALAAAFSACAVCLLAGLREPPRPAAAAAAVRRSIATELREGIAFVGGHVLLRPVFITQVIFAVAAFVLQAAYVPYAVHHLGLSAFEAGATLACYGGGMVAGALAATRISGRLPFGWVIGIGPVAGLAAALLMALTIALPSAWLAGLSFFLMGAGPILWVIATTTLRQTVTPRALLGRVSAINTLAYGARPVGAAIGAGVGALYGAEVCIVVAAALFALQAVVILASPAVRLRAQPQMAAA
jgi:MFS family permease